MAVVIMLLVKDFALLMEVVVAVNITVATRVRNVRLYFAELTEVEPRNELFPNAKGVKVMAVVNLLLVKDFALLMEVVAAVNMAVAVKIAQEVVVHFALLTVVVATVSIVVAVKILRKMELNFVSRMELGNVTSKRKSPAVGTPGKTL
jgi:hypothetical protein